MIEDRGLPAFVIVTSVACLAVFGLMLVIGTVAFNAGRRQFCLEAILVTTSARRGLVLVIKRKFGFLVVVEVGLGPADFLMTSLTLVTKRALVGIIFQMARHATRWQLLRVQRRAMTGFTFCGQVFAQQRIACLPGMIKLAFPVLCVVACLAFFAISSLVIVVFLVTTYTGSRRVLVAFIRMAGFTLRRIVLAGESKASLAVIEFHLFPGILIVAIHAFVAQITFVLVVFFVAAYARQRSIAIFYFGGVAGSALCLLMGALKRKISVRVVKGLLIYWGDVNIAAFVVRMARIAFFVLNRRRQAVKAAIGLQVLRHGFVTIQTKSALIGLLELGVTFIALRFYLGMSGNHFSGHDEALERLSVCG